MWRNPWRFKEWLLTSTYFLIEVTAIAFDITINRHSWWYTGLVMILILLYLATAYRIATTGRMTGGTT